MRNHFSTSTLLRVAALCFFAASPTLAQTAPRYIITGRVHDESNRGVAGVRVCGVPEDYAQHPRVHCPLSDADGNFVIRAERSVRYKIHPHKADAGYMSQSRAFYRNVSVPILEVVPTAANANVVLQVPLGPKNGTVIGRILDLNTGKRIDNVRFLLCQAADPRACWSFSAKSAEGDFRFLAAHVPFTLKVSAKSYEDWWGLNGYDKGPISLSSGTMLELEVLMRRRQEALQQPLDESEKQRFTHLPAPVQTFPRDRVELNGYPRLMKLEWQPVEGAVNYQVEVDYCEGFRERECFDPQPHTPRTSPPTLLPGTSYEFSFVGAQPGRWRVWAIDKNGQEGFKSPWWTFFHLK